MLARFLPSKMSVFNEEKCLHFELQQTEALNEHIWFEWVDI
jgi:hypothetical protein